MFFNSNRSKATAWTFVLLLAAYHAFPQDRTLSLDDIPAGRVPVKNAFNGPHVILSQSTNMLQAKQLDLVFGHRFGKINEGAFNAFGLDQAFIRIGAEYGLTDWLSTGIGRSSLGKNYDFYLKYRPLVQTKGGTKNIPVSCVVFLSSAFSSNELRRQNDIDPDYPFANQLVYTWQTSVSRQFTTVFSAQVTGSFVHRNSVPSALYNNNVYGISAGVRIKATERIHFLTEYYHLFNNSNGIYNPIAFGMDVVAGGHVFNVHLTNSAGIIEKEYLTATTDSVSRGGLRLGFTIRRSFMLGAKVDGGKVKY